MNRMRGLVTGASEIFRRAAMIIAGAMALLITTAIVMRAMKTPMAGEHELVELMMLSMVMFGLSSVQSDKGHIAIEVLVDRFPLRWQALCDLLAGVLTAAGCAIIGWANMTMAWEYATFNPMSTDYLSLPLYPFKVLVGLGFWLWGLQAIVGLPAALSAVRDGQAGHHGAKQP